MQEREPQAGREFRVGRVVEAGRALGQVGAAVELDRVQPTVRIRLQDHVNLGRLIATSDRG